MLEDIYKNYRQYADKINWQEYTCNELFFKYIEHESDPLRDNFYAGIVCRYWGYTGRLYLQCNKHVTFEQCYDVLIDTINYVLKKRVWEQPGNSLYNDERGPDKAFHIVLKRQRSLLLANLTAYKRKTNFNTMSLDGIHEEYNDAGEGLFNIFETSESSEVTLKELIVGYYNSGYLLGTIFLDTICYSGIKICPKNIINYIKKLSKDDFTYYNTYYGVSLKDYDNLLYNLKLRSTKSLLMELKRVLYLLRKEFEFD